jgi:hypothetical protein
MRKPLVLAALLAVACTGTAADSQPAEAGRAAAPPTSWGQRADALIDRAMAADQSDGSTLGDSMLAVALLLERGPDDVATSHYLQRLLSHQHPSGGFGTDTPWDTWSDGSVNPASTDYTVSIAGHAWPALRDAIAAGVEYADVLSAAERAITRLWEIPYIPVKPGVCLSYSAHSNDLAGYCVHNINAGAAAALVEAWSMGVGPQDPSWLTAGVTQTTAAFANRKYRGHTYSTGSGSIQDPAHNAYTIESLHTLAPGLADNFALYNLQGQPTHVGNPHWGLAHVDLAALAGRKYCEYLDDWAGEFDAAAATLGSASFDFDLLAQYAEKAATAAEVCE